MHDHLPLFLLFALVCAGSECAANPLARVPDATGACREQRGDRVMFGMNSPDGPIDEIEWTRFLADTVTPRFPEGLTVYQTHGQWRGQDGRIEREASRVVEIIHDGDEAALVRMAEIIAGYKSRYRQESVLVISQRVTACF